MRNVTKNETTAEKAVTKRGRGRPRKLDALTNAQRQAAYRARKRDESLGAAGTRPGGSYRDMRVLRAELVQLRDALRVEQEKMLSLAKTYERQAASIRKRAVLAEEDLNILKASRKSDRDAPAFEVMLELLAMACARKSFNAQSAIRNSDLWQKSVIRAANVTEEQTKRLSAALAGRTGL